MKLAGMAEQTLGSSRILLGDGTDTGACTNSFKGKTMPTTRLKSTLEAVQGGVKNLPVEKAITNIEGWESYLEKHDEEGVKKVLTHLSKLKKLLQAKEIDSEAIGKLVATLGKDTVAVAGKDENANAKHIRELGEALSGK